MQQNKNKVDTLCIVEGIEQHNRIEHEKMKKIDVNPIMIDCDYYDYFIIVLNYRYNRFIYQSIDQKEDFFFFFRFCF